MRFAAHGGTPNALRSFRGLGLSWAISEREDPIFFLYWAIAAWLGLARSRRHEAMIALDLATNEPQPAFAGSVCGGLGWRCCQ